MPVITPFASQFVLLLVLLLVPVPVLVLVLVLLLILRLADIMQGRCFTRRRSWKFRRSHGGRRKARPSPRRSHSVTSCSSLPK